MPTFPSQTVNNYKTKLNQILYKSHRTREHGPGAPRGKRPLYLSKPKQLQVQKRFS